MFTKVELRLAKQNINNAIYRFRQRGCNEQFTLQEWIDVCEKHNYKCAECGASGKLTIDHIVPFSRGGGNTIANIRPLCPACNKRKGPMPAYIKDLGPLTGCHCSVSQIARLDAVCDTLGISRSDGMRAAYQMFIEHYERKDNEQ